MNAPTQASTELSASQQFVDWALQLRCDALSDHVVSHARRLLLDSIGIAVASTGQDFGRRFQNLPRDAVEKGSTALGLPGRFPAERAALINGVLAHGLDFDDTYQPGFVHIGSIVIPTVLAVAEEVGASSDDTVTAIVAGYEFSSRIGEAAPRAFHKYGWHATPLCGAFASALVSGMLMGLSRDDVVTAIGIVGSFASGIQEFLRDGTDTKRLHTGWAAQAGISAARLAQIGFGGPARILEGHYGLYATHLREDDPVDHGAIVAELGERWNVTSLSIKPYPACHLMHAHIDAARRLVAQGAKPSEIVAIRAYIHETGLHVVGEPADAKKRPRTPYGAQFSLPYGVAIGFADADRTVDLTSFSQERLEDPELLRLAGITECLLDEESQVPRYLDGAVEVDLADGRTLHERETINRGSPERPLEDAELEEKFVANVRIAGVPEEASREAATEIFKGTEFVGTVSRLNDLVVATTSQS